MPIRTWARFAIWVLLVSIIGLPLTERSADIFRLTAAARVPVSGQSADTAYTQAHRSAATAVHTGAIYAPRPPAEAKAAAEPKPQESRLAAAGGAASCPFGTAETSARIRLVLANRSSQTIPSAVRRARRRDVPRTWLPRNCVFLHTVQNHSSYL